ncbi:MAG: type II toxin-antitoxin system RelE/ParE family toxin [Myxococcaceae bacterium]|nr:type II toxin-antitoxin system RelE/ParE family toxin [Myxococcaceae bacterium]
MSHAQAADLDAIADFIALDKPAAAKALVQRVLAHVDQLAAWPHSGPALRELRGYRQLVEPPCRIFYRVDGDLVFILHVMRSERRLRRSTLPR